jgi:hypothetical protein
MSKNDMPFTKVEANLIPLSVFEKLKRISYDKRVPLAQLIAIAVDNELDSPHPFNFPCDLPTTPFIEGAYFKEAQQIHSFLMRYWRGMDKETLMLCRREIGIEDRSALLHGLRELLSTDTLVEEFIPKRTNFSYDRDYRRIRARQERPNEKKPRGVL